MSDVRRVGVEAQDDGVYEVWVDPNGTDALMSWEDYEDLQLQLGAKPGQYDYAELDTRWQKLVKRNDEQREEYERLRKVVDAAEALIQAQQKPGERVPVTYYADFGRRIQTLRDALRELEES
jgi:hypothetical protein